MRLNYLDKAGIFCSGVCAIHCLLVPFFTLASSASASYFESEWIHVVLLFFIVPIAIVSFYRHRKIHKKIKPMKLGYIGLFFLILAIMCEPLFKIEIKGLELVFTIIGSTFLMVGHYLNMQLLNGCLNLNKDNRK